MHRPISAGRPAGADAGVRGPGARRHASTGCAPPRAAPALASAVWAAPCPANPSGTPLAGAPLELLAQRVELLAFGNAVGKILRVREVDAEDDDVHPALGRRDDEQPDFRSLRVRLDQVRRVNSSDPVLVADVRALEVGDVEHVLPGR